MASRTRATLIIALVLAAAGGAAWWWTSRGPEAPRTLEVAAPGGETTDPAAAGAPEPTPAQVAPQAGEEARQALAGNEPAVRAAPLEVELAGPDGKPLAKARVALFTPEKLLGVGETDASGVAKFAADSGRGEALVVARGSAPWRAPLELAAGRRKLAAPPSDVFAGTLRVDRAAPAEPVELELFSDRPLFDTAGIADAVLEALELRERSRVILVAATDEHGGFRFDGLSQPFSGRIDLPDSLWVASTSSQKAKADRNTVRLAALEHELAIDAVELPSVRGRVVERAGGPGVADATVGVWCGFVSTDPERERPLYTSGMRDVRTDDEGRFRVRLGLPRGVDATTLASASGLPPVDRIGVEVSRGKGSDSVETEVPAARFAGPWDVGEIVLAPGRSIEFVVHDAAGAPIAGAVALCDVRSQPTDAQGHGRIDGISADADVMQVGALGWHEIDVPLPEEATAPLEVVLAPSNLLELRFADPEGKPLADQRALIASPEPIFAGGDGLRTSATHVAGGGAEVTRSRKYNGEWQCYVRGDADGRLLLSDLTAATTFEVRALDPIGQVLEERKLSIGPQESRTETFTVSGGAPFEGRVADDRGLPLSGATVSLSTGRRGAAVARKTDPSGVFRFERMSPCTVRVDVARDGFSPLTMSDYAIQPGGEPVEFRLSPALDIRLAVVDPAGRPVPAQDLSVQVASNAKLPVRRRGPNLFDLRSLPSETVKVNVRVGGRNFERDVDPTLGDGQVVVPEQGKAFVGVRLTEGPESGAEYHVRVAARNAQGRELENLPVHFEEAMPGALFEALLPGDYVAFLEVWKRVDGKNVHETIAGPVSFGISANAVVKADLVK